MLPEIEYKQYVIVPRKPRMSKGKIASQVAHATFTALDKQPEWHEKEGHIQKWKKKGMCVIVLECKDVAQLMGIAKYLDQWSVYNHLYIDEGITEVDMGTPTALATGVLTPEYYWMFSQLKMFRG